MSTDVKKNHSIDNFTSKQVMNLDRLQAHRNLEKHDDIIFNDDIIYHEEKNEDFVAPNPQNVQLDKRKGPIITNPIKQSKKLSVKSSY